MIDELQWIIDHIEEEELKSGYEHFFKNKYGCTSEDRYCGIKIIDEMLSMRREMKEHSGDDFDGFYRGTTAYYKHDGIDGITPLSQDKHLWRTYNLNIITLEEYKEYVELWKKRPLRHDRIAEGG